MQKNLDRLQAFMEKRQDDVVPVTVVKGRLRYTVKEGTDSGIKEVAKLIKPGGKVLDIGFGSGYALDVFKQMGYEVKGISLSLDEVAEQSEKHDVSLMDMSFMSFEPELFDLIWARHCLEHSIFPYFTLSELYRVMKEGACIYIEVPAPKQKSNHENYTNHYSVFGKLMWVSLMRRTGFKDITAAVLSVGNGKEAIDRWYRFIATKPQGEL